MLQHDAPHPGGAGADQGYVTGDADRHHHPDVAALETLPDDEDILGADGDDEAESECKAGEQSGSHTATLEPAPFPVQRKFCR